MEAILQILLIAALLSIIINTLLKKYDLPPIIGYIISGEFSFVVLELARIGGITTKDINQTLVIAVVFSMILTPFIVKNLQVIVEYLLGTRAEMNEPFSSSDLSGHVIILGYGSLVVKYVDILKLKVFFISQSIATVNMLMRVEKMVILLFLEMVTRSTSFQMPIFKVQWR